MDQNHLTQTHSQMTEVPELGTDPGYYSTSPQLVFPAASHTTPNTPTSIPDIILTGKE